jgi:hypothetical protein
MQWLGAQSCSGSNCLAYHTALTAPGAAISGIGDLQHQAKGVYMTTLLQVLV